MPGDVSKACSHVDHPGSPEPGQDEGDETGDRHQEVGQLGKHASDPPDRVDEVGKTRVQFAQPPARRGRVVVPFGHDKELVA